MLKRPAILSLLIGLQILSPIANALPEASINSRMNGAIEKTILMRNGDLKALKAHYSITQVPVLDQLWNSRRDVIQGSCQAPSNNCRVLSVFQGHASTHPVVLMPGFTGYRKMYLEEIYDLIQAGFGPIYISDFAGTGDSYKPELAPGHPEPTIAQVLTTNPSADTPFKNEVDKITGGQSTDLVSNMIQQLPIGIGHIDKFAAYQLDVDFIMNQAVKENPTAKLLVTSLSMSGLVLAIALEKQGNAPTWITHVDRILLESPMLRTLGTNLALPVPGLGSIAQFASSIATLFGSQRVLSINTALPEFADKALGNFNPNNLISHSPYRLSMTDSLRVYNGHETTGATFGWTYQELANQYADGILDSKFVFVHPLNFRESGIVKALNDNHIKLITASSKGDGLVDTKATGMFLRDLADAGESTISFCLFETSKHVMDQESEKYRQPFMQLVIDQKAGLVRNQYGTEPQNELLKCHTVTPRFAGNNND